MAIRVNMEVKGKEYAPFVVTVERGKIKEFARAIGDLSPFYLDDTVGRASEWGDIIAPPTFPTTFRDENADTGAMLKDLGVDISRILHGEQEFEHSSRSGRARPTSASRGSPTSTRRRGGRAHGVRGAGDVGGGPRERDRVPGAAHHGGEALSPMRYAKIHAEDVQPGQEMPPLVKPPIQQIQLTRYAGASGDFNPIHQDDAFARAAGMGGVFAHGMLSMGFVAQSVTDWVGVGRSRRSRSASRRLVRPRRCHHLPRQGAREAPGPGRRRPRRGARALAENQKGEKVVTGRATVTLRSRG